MDTRVAFDRAARIYDRTRRQLLPCFDEFYGALLARIPFAVGDAFEVLDLGAGTGLLSAMVAAAFPRARFNLVDVSPEMLERARERFAGDPRFSFSLQDFGEAVPGRPDLVISALAIHHLDDDAKRALFARVLAALRPRGCFLNADQVLGPTPALERGYHERWLAQVRALGVPPADLEAALDRMRADRTAPLAPQLEWLRQAGFEQVECLYENERFAAYAGVRPAASTSSASASRRWAAIASRSGRVS